MSNYVIDWDQQAATLQTEASVEAAWHAAVAREIVRDTDRLVVDAGCGDGRMTRALAAALPPAARVVGVDGSAEMLAVAARESSDAGGRVAFVHASFERGFADAVNESVDLVWASMSVHHAGDQQAALDRLAELLAPGGRLALAEGGLPSLYLPWDVGAGEPGLESRLVAAGERWFQRMRAELPGSVRMPYGWPAALQRAGLGDVRTRTFLVELSAPLTSEGREVVDHALRSQVDRLADTGLLDAADLEAWRRLLDPGDPAWVGAREDTYVLRARSVHVAQRRSTT